MTSSTSTTDTKSKDTRDYSLMIPQLRQLSNTWIFTEETVLENSPSRQQKCTLAMELRYKESLVDFLIRLGTKLKLDSRTMLAATTYLHRFFMRVPISQSKYFVACAALLISCKLNDTYRQPETIAKIACNLKAPPGSKPIDTTNEIYWKWKDQLLYREELMLRKLNFDLDLILPYNIREWIFKNYHNSDSFHENKINILKMTTSMIEALSVLPLILCFEMNVIFGVCMIVTIIEGRRREGNEDLMLPNGLLRDFLNTDVEQCTKCFKFIRKVLKAGQQDPKLRSNSSLYERFRKVLLEEFETIAKGTSQKVDDKNGDNSSKKESNDINNDENKKSSIQEKTEEKKDNTKEIMNKVNDNDKDKQESKDESKENGERANAFDSKPNPSATEEKIGDKRSLTDVNEEEHAVKAVKTE